MKKETLEQKQQYLMENILEKGYDLDKFLEFLSNKKGESNMNLNNWSLQEIIKASNEFINNDQDSNKNNFQIEDNFNIINDKYEEKIPQEQYINCFLIEETPISKENKLEIKASEPKIEKGGFFSFSYCTYLLKTSPLNLEVRRRYSDLIWLYNILKTQFINCVIPPFFKKENLDKIKIDRRIYYIEIFLNNIANHPILRNSKIFYDFISIKEENDFINKKNEYNKLISSSDIKKLKTLNGELKVTLTYENEKYYQNIKEKLTSQDNLYEQLLYNYKILTTNITQVSEKMKEISKIWKELFNQKAIYFESECTSGIYNSLNIVLQNWSYLQNQQCILIKNYIKRFYKFIKEEFKCFRDLSYYVENTKNNYYKKKETLLSAKELIFSQKEKNQDKIKNESNNNIENERKKEIEFSKLMINDTEKVLELEKEYGCYLNCYIGEYERLRDLNSARIKKSAFNFIKELSVQLSNFNYSLGERISYIDSLTEEGYIGNCKVNNEIYNNAVPVAGKKM